MQPLEFRILGPLEIYAGDRQLPLRGRKQRALVAYLLLHANEVVPSDRLIEELWGEDVPTSGIGALHVRISQLRRALDEEGSDGKVLLTRPAGYLLRVDPLALDSRRFELKLTDGKALAADGEHGRAVDVLSQALALWRGPALADLAYEAFTRAEIARLEELRIACLEERISCELALGRHAEVIGELEALVATHPLRERVRGQLMVALYRSGRQADALASYRKGRETLVEELGIEPGDELRALEQAILRHDEWLAPPARPSASAAPVRPGPAEERKVVTVLFADMVDSTGLTTRVDPERARLTLTKYYDVVADEVEAAGGTLEKFVGDAVVAVFGAPIAQEDHAERALHTALAVQRQLKESFGGQLAVRIGVATGEVVIGNARAGGSLATGAAVNVAARLEQSADPGEILVGARTARAAGAAFEFGPTTVIEAKGMPAGIECRSLVRALALTPARRRPPRHGVRRARERI